MTMKLVNGVLTPLTAEEQAEYDARQSAPAANPVPASISRVQLMLGLVAAGLIPPEEGPPASSGMAIPALIDAVFSALPAAEANEARIRFNGAATFDRENPLINAVGYLAAGKTPEQMDAYWREWSAL